MRSLKEHIYSLRRLSLGVVMAILASVFLAAGACAQVDASLWGSVNDTFGAGIPGATIAIRNLETGKERILTTDESGRFNAPALVVGRYELSASKAGFRTDRRTSISLVIGQREEVNLTLQVGDVHQTVEVAADSDLIQITTEDISGLVGERQVKDLPLNGRSYDQLLTLNHGIVNYTSKRSGGVGTSNSVVGNMFAVSGRRPQ